MKKQKTKKGLEAENQNEPTGIGDGTEIPLLRPNSTFYLTK